MGKNKPNLTFVLIETYRWIYYLNRELTNNITEVDLLYDRVIELEKEINELKKQIKKNK